MELEKKCPELQDLGSQMDGLSVSDAIGDSNETADVSGVLGAIKKIFDKWNICQHSYGCSLAFQNA